MGRERRRRIRRTGTDAAAGEGVTGTLSSSPRPALAGIRVRSDRVIQRESENMMREMKRVALVSGVCFGMLALLMVVDRLS